MIVWRMPRERPLVGRVQGRARDRRLRLDVRPADDAVVGLETQEAHVRDAPGFRAVGRRLVPTLLGQVEHLDPGDTHAALRHAMDGSPMSCSWDGPPTMLA